mmetsp:Transcript_19356/g.37654  ORF Transcript_19356/g.37654 Transcript_19356/m.37654 type:complete len:310 (+) Transcript_19356:263-1192(+)
MRVIPARLGTEPPRSVASVVSALTQLAYPLLTQHRSPRNLTSRCLCLASLPALSTHVIQIHRCSVGKRIEPWKGGPSFRSDAATPRFGPVACRKRDEALALLKDNGTRHQGRLEHVCGYRRSLVSPQLFGLHANALRRYKLFNQLDGTRFGLLPQAVDGVGTRDIESPSIVRDGDGKRVREHDDGSGLLRGVCLDILASRLCVLAVDDKQPKFDGERSLLRQVDREVVLLWNFCRDLLQSVQKLGLRVRCQLAVANHNHHQAHGKVPRGPPRCRLPRRRQHGRACARGMHSNVRCWVLSVGSYSGCSGG